MRDEYGFAVPATVPAAPLRKVLVEPLTNREVARFVATTAQLVGIAAGQLDAGDTARGAATLRELRGHVDLALDRLCGPKRPL